MRWERLEWISNLQPFAGFNFSSCIPLSSPALLSDVYCVSVAGRCDPLSLDPTFPRGIFPAPSRGPVREERTSEWCAAGLAYLQAVRRSVGHGPARPASPCSPGLEREFLLHSILNSLASGDRGARTSVVCTRPQICHSSGRAAGQIRIFIWAAWLCYLMRHVKAECVTTGPGVRPVSDTDCSRLLHRDRCLNIAFSSRAFTFYLWPLDLKFYWQYISQF